MKSRGILMTTVMVEALLKGTKTETRRVTRLKTINEHPDEWAYNWIDVKEDGLYARFESTIGKSFLSIKCPYGFVEDQLWVRETFSENTNGLGTWIEYKAAAPTDGEFSRNKLKWQPSLFMPKIASRFDLEIVNITCERLQDITEEGAIAEGVEYVIEHDCQGYVNYLDKNSFETPIESYRSLFNLINGEYSWDKNPWVWVVKFKDISGKK